MAFSGTAWHGEPSPGLCLPGSSCFASCIRQLLLWPLSRQSELEGLREHLSPRFTDLETEAQRRESVTKMRQHISSHECSNAVSQPLTPCSPLAP